MNKTRKNNNNGGNRRNDDEKYKEKYKDNTRKIETVTGKFEEQFAEGGNVSRYFILFIGIVSRVESCCLSKSKSCISVVE